jgi:hypothetical protein
MGDFTLKHGDWVKFVIATDRRDKLQRATKIELMDESFQVGLSFKVPFLETQAFGHFLLSSFFSYLLQMSYYPEQHCCVIIYLEVWLCRNHIKPGFVGNKAFNLFLIFT